MTADQPASDVVDGLQTMLVDRYREALRQAVDALKPFHEAFQGYYGPVQLDPRLTFEAFARASGICLRPDIVRLLAGEPEPVSTCSHCFCLLEADESATCCKCRGSLAKTCDKCGGRGEVTVQTYLSGVRASIPCPVCRPAQTETGAE